MVFVDVWEEFEIAAENMYMENPIACRYTMKYVHTKGYVLIKMTDNLKCLQYKAEHWPEIKKMEKFISNLMGHMASEE